MAVNKKPIERIYPKDKRVEPQTIAHHKARYKFAARLRKIRGGIIYDFGCGTGYGTEMLRRAGYEYARGFDISEKAINFASANYRKCKFLVEDLAHSEFPAESFCDLVTMFEVIEHLKHDVGVKLVKDAYRLLRPGGIFMMSTPRDSNKYNDFHLSEWPYHEIKNVLGPIFEEVRIYGQDWDTAKITDKNVPNEDFYIAVCTKLKIK